MGYDLFTSVLATSGDEITGDDFISVAPDRKHFFTVTRRGLLADDSNIYSLRVFSVAAIRHAFDRSAKDVVPLSEISVGSASFQSAIYMPKWSADSQSILWYEPGRSAQIDGASTPSRIVAFDIARSAREVLREDPFELEHIYLENGGVVYRRATLVLSGEQLTAYPMYRPPLRGDASPDLGAGRKTSYVYFAAYRGGAAHAIEGQLDAIEIAPDGRKAFAVQSRAGAQRLILVDLVAGTVQPIADCGAPTACGASRGLWDRQARRLVITWKGGALSLYDITQNAMRPLPSLPANAVDQTLTFDDTLRSSPRNGHGTGYDLIGAAWRPAARQIPRFAPNWRDPSEIGDLTLFVEQGINSPPELKAAYLGQERVLIGPDPILGKLWRARAQRVVWQEKGMPGQGWLLLPRTPAPAGGFPLVVQLSASIDDRLFAPDGPVSAGYAGQALVARGLAVLIVRGMQGGARGDAGGVGEGPAIAARVEAAITAAAAMAPIDRSRIGAVGHSRMGFQVGYLTTHPGRTPLAAAVIMDSFMGDYPAMLTQAAQLDLPIAALKDATEKIYGGPIGTHFETWRANEFTLNADKVTAPILFQRYSESLGINSGGGSTGLMGALRLARKPADIQYFATDAAHVLVRPRQRFLAMQAVVDWMTYWLQDEAPSDAETAARFRALRTLQDKSR